MKEYREERRTRTEPWGTLTLRGGEMRKNQQRERTASEVDGKPGVLAWKPSEESSQTRGHDSLVAKAVRGGLRLAHWI